MTGIITGEDTKIVERRAEKLKVDFLRQGIKEKLSAIQEICEEKHIDMAEVAYVGDDINDLNAIKAVGVGCSVNNALEKIKMVPSMFHRKMVEVVQSEKLLTGY